MGLFILRRTGVMLLTALCLTMLFAIATPSRLSAQPAGGDFVGSAACRDCHEAVYARWQDSLMANILVDVAASESCQRA